MKKEPENGTVSHKRRKVGRPRTQRQLSLTDARTQESLARTEKLRLTNRKLARDLIDVREVTRVWEHMLARFRARALQMPSKVFPLVMASRGPAETKAVLDAGVNEFLLELSEFDLAEIPDVEIDDESDAGTEAEAQGI